MARRHDPRRDPLASHHYVPESGRHLGVYDRLRGEIVTDLSDGPSHVPTSGAPRASLFLPKVV